MALHLRRDVGANRGTERKNKYLKTKVEEVKRSYFSQESAFLSRYYIENYLNINLSVGSYFHFTK